MSICEQVCVAGVARKIFTVNLTTNRWVCFEPDAWEEEAMLTKDMFTELSKQMTTSGDSNGIADLRMGFVDTKNAKGIVENELGCFTYPTLVYQTGNLYSDGEDGVKKY